MLAIVLCSLLPARAQATPTSDEACAEAFEKSQIDRRAGHLLDARAALATCSQSTCPAFLVNECVPALQAIQNASPSVVFAVRDALGHATVDAQVFVDDMPPLATVPSTAVLLDPGVHNVRVRSAGETRDTTVVLREGEKAVRVEVTFERVTGLPKEPPPPPPSRSSAIPPITLVLGGLSIAGFASFSAVALSSLAEEKRLRRDCAPICSADDTSRVKSLYFVADLALAVGIISSVMSVVTFLTRPAVQ